MKVSDYIVKFLENQKVFDIFGIPGVGCGHFMNSLIGSKITSHLVYHEQAAAFAACGYAQTALNVGFAYTTAGPGGTNLITGIANAFCDSIPTVFMVGEKDLSSLRGLMKTRQKASQEVDIVNICKPITKWSYQITNKEEVRYVLEKAFYIAKNGRPGPVLIDFPSDIQRSDIQPEILPAFNKPKYDYSNYNSIIVESLKESKKPLLLIGNGIKQSNLEKEIAEISNSLNIPIVTTLVCIDVLTDQSNKIGYIGLDGDYAANKAINECDLLITFGARLNFKQVTENRHNFAPNAKIIRIDCDINELEYKIRDEISICADLKCFIKDLSNQLSAFSHS